MNYLYPHFLSLNFSCFNLFYCADLLSFPYSPFHEVNSCINFRVRCCLYSEIIHSDWSKLVTWLPKNTTRYFRVINLLDTFTSSLNKPITIYSSYQLPIYSSYQLPICSSYQLPIYSCLRLPIYSSYLLPIYSCYLLPTCSSQHLANCFTDEVCSFYLFSGYDVTLIK